MVLAPNTITDFAVASQPGLTILWKYPLQAYLWSRGTGLVRGAQWGRLTFLHGVFSAMPFPLPWSLIPRNTILNLVVGYALLSDTRIKGIIWRLREEVAPSITLMTVNELGVPKTPPPGLPILIANSPDIDYPFSVLPPHITPCGPIVYAAPLVGGMDPASTEWLSRGLTVYINLGTNLKLGPEEASEMARAFRD